MLIRDHVTVGNGAEVAEVRQKQDKEMRKRKRKRKRKIAVSVRACVCAWCMPRSLQW